MKYTWLLFDADGTLFDYHRAEEKAIWSAFAEMGHPLTLQDVGTYQRINRQIWVEFENKRISSKDLRVRRFELLLDDMGIEADPGLFSACYLRHLGQGTELVPGAEEVVAALRGHYRLGLITNGLHDVQRPRLEGSKIAGVFDVVAISEEIGAAKPDPAFFDFVFEQIRRPAKESVLVIGDGLTSDIQGGYLYGLDTCWFNPGGQPPDPRFPATYEIQRLDQLIQLLFASKPLPSS